MRIPSFIFLLFAIHFVDGSAIASDFLYLSADAVDISSIPAPPESGSDEEVDDLSLILKLQRKRNNAQCSRAQSEHSLDFSAEFGGARGPLSKKELKAGEELYEEVRDETDYFVSSLKMHFDRERPYSLSRKVKPCLPLETSSSFPSRHAAITREAALVFGLIYPKKAKALMARAEEIALDRMIGGADYPSDIKAGKELANLVFDQLKLSERFQAALENAHQTGD